MNAFYHQTQETQLDHVLLCGCESTAHSSVELPVLSWPMLQEEERAWLHPHGQKPSFLECMTIAIYNKICLDAAHRNVESMPKMIGRILKRKGKRLATDQSIFSSI